MVALGWLPGSDPEKVTVGRSAKHSHFPECTGCQSRREHYHKLLRTPGTAPAVLKEAFDDMLKHNQDLSEVLNA